MTIDASSPPAPSTTAAAAAGISAAAIGHADMLPEGLRDRLPPMAAAAAALQRVTNTVLASHGYAPVSPPMAEFERSLAHRMQGVDRHNMVRFVDPVSKRTMAVRSDMTVQVGRVATTMLADAPRPLRLSYAGQVLRLTTDALHPERERLQIGAELIGYDNVAAAQEIVGVAVEALAAAGAREIMVDLTLPDLVETLAKTAFPLAPDAMTAVQRELDTKDAGGLKALGADAYLPLLYAMGPFADAIEALTAIDAGGALASRIKGLKDIVAALPAAVTVTLDPTESHGFEYQSWFGFTLYAAGVSGPLGRGGSYAIPNGRGGYEVATGFSLYPDVLLGDAAMTAPDAPQRLFLPLGHDVAAAAQARANGWCTIAALDGGDDAATLGCAHILQAGGITKIGG